MFNPFDREIAKVYGPYLRDYPCGPSRYQVVIVFSDGSRTSMSNARWLMTQHLGRSLDKDEDVDHIDENPQNDALGNLQILSKSENIRKHNVGKPSPLKGTEKDWKHGTAYAWMKKKCRCEICLPAWREWHNKRNAARRAAVAK